MTDISIREATHKDSSILKDFLKLMVEEMASVGGYAVSKDQAVWTQIEHEIRDNISREDHVYLVVFPSDQPESSVGFAAAQVENVEPIFEPRRLLHVSALYVLRSYRGKGIGKLLLQALFDWGRGQGCAEAELNTLVGNPARSLYETMGFAEFEIKMKRTL